MLVKSNLFELENLGAGVYLRAGNYEVWIERSKHRLPFEKTTHSQCYVEYAGARFGLLVQVSCLTTRGRPMTMGTGY